MKLKDTGFTAEQIKEKVHKYMIETYERFDFLAETADGMYLYDENGTPYLDFYAGIAVNSAGNCNPKVVAAVKDELDDIIKKCAALDCHMVVVVPSCDLNEKGIEATRQEIRDDAVAVLKEMVKKCEPTGLKLSLEFCGAPSMSINTFDDAYEIVKLVDSPLMGVTLDQYHFYAMASAWDALEKADGKKIFVWHLNGTEDLPCGAPYNNDEKRLWPDAEGDCLDQKRYADTLRKIGFEGDCCTIEIFRPAYYEMTQEENVRKSAEVTRAHVAKYC